MPHSSEYQKTLERVEFGNSPSTKKRPDSTLREILDSNLKKAQIEVFPVMPIFDVQEMTEFLYIHPDFNRIHSILSDYLESIPYRPDMAMDSAWQGLEVLMWKYARTNWQSDGNGKGLIDFIPRIINELILPSLQSNESLNNAFNELLGLMPYSIARYALIRMLIDREIKVASQFDMIHRRAKDIIGDRLLKLFTERYVSENGKVDGANHRAGAMKIHRMVNGERMTFFGKEVEGLSFAERIEFIISCILYASRCERFHGDYFSPFMSDKARYSHYAHWYWMLLMTQTLCWCVLSRSLNRLGFGQLLPAETIATCLQSNLENYKILFHDQIKNQ